MKHARPRHDPGLIRESHKPTRTFLRVAGPVVLLIGVGFMAIGLVSFFGAFGGGGFPRYFWCCFVGMPLIFAGKVMTGAGFMGALFRYQASETAPVTSDTFNYVAENTKPGVHAVVSTAASALREDLNSDESVEHASEYCPACNDTNDPDARFCNHCGTELPLKQPTEIACGACQTPNDLNARFCDTCGEKLVH